MLLKAARVDSGYFERKHKSTTSRERDHISREKMKPPKNSGPENSHPSSVLGVGAAATPDVPDDRGDRLGLLEGVMGLGWMVVGVAALVVLGVGASAGRGRGVIDVPDGRRRVRRR